MLNVALLYEIVILK